MSTLSQNTLPTGILAENNILTELDLFIGDYRNLCTKISVITASACYYAVEKKDGTILQEIYNKLGNFERFSKHWLAWVSAITPFHYDNRKERMKYSQSMADSMAHCANLETLYLHILTNNMDSYKVAKKDKKVLTKEQKLERLSKQYTALIDDEDDNIVAQDVISALNLPVAMQEKVTFTDYFDLLDTFETLLASDIVKNNSDILKHIQDTIATITLELKKVA